VYLGAYINVTRPVNSANRCSYKLSKILRIRKATILYGGSNQNDDKGRKSVRFGFVHLHFATQILSLSRITRHSLPALCPVLLVDRIYKAER